MKKVVIHRTRIGKDIVAEFAVPQGKKSSALPKIAILATGAPGMPGKSALVEFLMKKGYYVVNPRYRGSWESGGQFLQHEPTEDIREVINALQSPLVSLYENTSYAFPKKARIHLFVSSFGGPAGFLLSKMKQVEKVIAFSPVCDWTAPSKSEPLDIMNRMTKLLYGEGYRLSKQGWAGLARGTFYNPMTTLPQIDGSKCLIFHARNDDVVPFDSVFDFAYATGATLKATRTGGHMGLGEAMNPETWREINAFLKR